MKMINCARCNAEVEFRVNRIYCPDCKDLLKREQEARCRALAREKERRSLPKAPTPRASRPVFISDAEQMSINISIDNRHAFKMAPAVCYRPGSPEWDQIVKQVTPLHRITSKESYF